MNQNPSWLFLWMQKLAQPKLGGWEGLQPRRVLPSGQKPLPTGLHELRGEERIVAPLSCSVSLSWPLGSGRNCAPYNKHSAHKNTSKPLKMKSSHLLKCFPPLEKHHRKGQASYLGKLLSTFPRPERPQVRRFHTSQKVLWLAKLCETLQLHFKGNAGCRPQSAFQGIPKLENERPLSGSLGPWWTRIRR